MCKIRRDTLGFCRVMNFLVKNVNIIPGLPFCWFMMKILVQFQTERLVTRYHIKYDKDLFR